MSYSGRYSMEELNLIQTNGLTVEEIDKQWSMFPLQNIDTVIGSVQMLKKGEGQERNEPFSPEPAQVAKEELAEEAVGQAAEQAASESVADSKLSEGTSTTE